MDIRIHTDVQCANGPCGRSANVILKPTTRQVTHLMVREQPFVERSY